MNRHAEARSGANDSAAPASRQGGGPGARSSADALLAAPSFAGGLAPVGGSSEVATGLSSDVEPLLHLGNRICDPAGDFATACVRVVLALCHTPRHGVRTVWLQVLVGSEAGDDDIVRCVASMLPLLAQAALLAEAAHAAPGGVPFCHISIKSVWEQVGHASVETAEHAAAAAQLLQVAAPDLRSLELGKLNLHPNCRTSEAPSAFAAICPALRTATQLTSLSIEDS